MQSQGNTNNQAIVAEIPPFHQSFTTSAIDNRIEQNTFVVKESQSLNSSTLHRDINIKWEQSILKLVAEYCDKRGECIVRPSQKAINISFLIWLELGDVYKEKITRKEILLDGGIVFEAKNRNFQIYLEVYNSGEVGFIVEDINSKKIIDNQDINFRYLRQSNLFAYLA